MAPLMLAAIAALPVKAGPDTREYRLSVRGRAGATVSLRSHGPQGWIESFCTNKVCALGHTSVRIGSGGDAIVKFDVFRTDRMQPRTADVTVSEDDVPQVTLHVTVR